MDAKLQDKLMKKFKFLRPTGTIQTDGMVFGIQCGDGWFKLIWDLCSDIEKELKKDKTKGFKASQVKEKYGSLRFYFDDGNEKIHELVQKAEDKSYKTCEVCGKPGKPNDDGWITTLCSKCRKKKG